jgi:hypothetical protein
MAGCFILLGQLVEENIRVLPSKVPTPKRKALIEKLVVADLVTRIPKFFGYKSNHKSRTVP